MGFWRGVKRFFARLVSLETNERKNISLWMMFGGGIVFTLYAIAGLVLLTGQPHFVFWLAIAAHVQIFSIIAGFIGQLIKRKIFVGKEGLGITDAGGDLETPSPPEVKSTQTVPVTEESPQPDSSPQPLLGQKWT